MDLKGKLETVGEPVPAISPQMALETIDKALATINANRASHALLQRCVAVLAQAIGPASPTGPRFLGVPGHPGFGGDTQRAPEPEQNAHN